MEIRSRDETIGPMMVAWSLHHHPKKLTELHSKMVHMNMYNFNVLSITGLSYQPELS